VRLDQSRQTAQQADALQQAQTILQVAVDPVADQSFLRTREPTQMAAQYAQTVVQVEPLVAVTVPPE
jgi:hypothetical protein